MKKRTTLLLVLLLAFTLSFSLTACGRKTLPKSNFNSEKYAWQNVGATINNDCLTVFGTVDGNINSVDTITLEVQGLTEACVNCPFATEMHTTVAAVEVIDFETNVFQINYCPAPVYDEYRWRISGKNKVSGIEDVRSQVITTKK